MDRFSFQLGIDTSWEVHSWECNPDVVRGLGLGPRGGELERHGFRYPLHPEACWIEDKTAPMRLERSGDEWTGWGSTIVPESTIPSEMRAVDVPHIDIVRWIADRYTARTEVELFVKMDIERAEFAILRSMLAGADAGSGIFHNIRCMWVEEHERFLPNESQETWKALWDRLNAHTLVLRHD